MTEMAENKKKENFFKRAAKGTSTYAKATKSELKKVSWPTRKQLINNTAIVIVCIVVIGAFIALLDMVFGSGFRFFVTREDKKAGDELPTGAIQEAVTGSVESANALDELASENVTDTTDAQATE